MSKLRAIVLLTLVLGVAFGTAAAKDAPFLAVTGTASQVAVLAPFVSAGPGIDTAMSVSNILGAPEGLLDVETMTDTAGTIEFFIWRDDGNMYHFETSDNTLGNKILSDEGVLAPGYTFTIMLSEVVAAAGVTLDEGETFSGYVWVVGNFDAITGTSTLFYSDLNFAQSFNMEPTFGGVYLAGMPVDLE